MAYDSARGKVVLFGGCDSRHGAVCRTPGSGTGRAGRGPTGRRRRAKPAARCGHAMAYDSARGKVVLFGGASDAWPSQDTWEWDGASGTWTDRTSPAAQSAAR